MNGLKIVLLCVIASIIYGILHDQVTARVCVEYFTIGHPPVFGTESPTLLALGWGVIATWWVGAILGIPLAVAARAGPPPRRSWPDLVAPIRRLLLVMACSAAVLGTAGYVLARSGTVAILGPIAARVPPERHAAFIADLWAHNASYGIGFVGGIVLIVRTRRGRGRERREARCDE